MYVCVCVLMNCVVVDQRVSFGFILTCRRGICFFFFVFVHFKAKVLLDSISCLTCAFPSRSSYHSHNHSDARAPPDWQQLFEIENSALSDAIEQRDLDGESPVLFLYSQGGSVSLI